MSGANLDNDRRLELYLAACRQKKSICGDRTIADTVAAGNAAGKRQISTGEWGFTKEGTEKCTWFMKSKTKAPTFAVSTGTTAAKTFSDKWDIIYQEWVDGWQLSKGVDFADDHSTAGTVVASGGVVFPHIVAAKWSKVYKHNFATTLDNGQQGLAGSNNGQTAGEAWTYVYPNGTKASCVTDASDLNTGANDPSGCFNTLQKRWFTVDTSAVRYQQAEAADYSAKLSAFNTAATAYNAYLAKIKENAEVDAFAAFFSPPEKPAFVKRPDTPR